MCNLSFLFLSLSFLVLIYFSGERARLGVSHDVTLTVRNASVQQLLNLRRPRRDRGSPLRRQRPHIQILSKQQQDALQALDFSAEQDRPAHARNHYLEDDLMRCMRAPEAILGFPQGAPSINSLSSLFFFFEARSNEPASSTRRWRHGYTCKPRSLE